MTTKVDQKKIVGYWYCAALVCSLLPFVVGVLIFFSWLASRQSELFLFGYFTILGGIILFPCGLAATFIFARKSRKYGQMNKTKVWAAILLLLLNFPIALVMARHVNYLYGEYHIVITNQSVSAIDRGILKDPSGSECLVPRIAPGSSYVVSCLFEGEGRVSYELNVNGQVLTDILLGYITSGIGGDAAHLTLKSDYSVIVKEERQEFRK